MMGQALLYLGLQGAVFGISGGIAMHDDTVGLTGDTDGARVELRVRFRIDEILNSCIRVTTDLIELAQGELVQIYRFKRKVKSPAAHIGGAGNDLVRKFVLEAK